ncbi:MAG TPA: hypothetical protein VFV67_33235 [Actinophytocola sp.]|uniref:hypothetical protein n=1 Tax=Actinophytocola sp. TaxID=1872138 RepID=UPI002DB94DCF|nr:hypothetical protein [Actinophytocola sp.]HEU5475533.1 hypothetical protein [Actinophytocola sp.]
MGDPSRATGRSAVVALFAVAGCALLAATTLTVFVVLDDAPESSAPAAVAASRPSPTTAPPPGPRNPVELKPICLIGSWRTVDERFMIKFYTDQGLIPFVASGRTFTFRPDGTGVMSEDGVVYTGSFRGNQLRIVGHGNLEFTWTADDKTLTYVSYTRSDLSFAYFDQRGHLSTQPVNADPQHNEVDNYTCEGNRMTESNPATQYQSAWVRTADFGMY